MTKENFFFTEKVGVLPKHDGPMEFKEPIRAKIELVQNGYELRYEDKNFIASNLEEALGMIKSWMEMGEKESKSKDKEPEKSDS